MKHFLIFNYDFPKYVRLDVGNETRMHLDKQGRYLLQPNRINGRVYYEQITGMSSLNIYGKFARGCPPTKTPTQTLKNGLSTFGCQEIGLSSVSFEMIFENLQFGLKIPGFNPYMEIPIDLETFLVEKEKGEVILNEDYNNKQKERVRRDFKDKIHHHGMKKEDARESLRLGQIFTRVTFIWVILNMTVYGL